VPAGVLDWTWAQALEIAFSGMLTAIIIMIFMVVMLRVLQVLAYRNQGKKTGNMEPKSILLQKSSNSSNKEENTGKQVVAVITAAVYNYIKEQDPSYKAGRITVTRHEPVVAASTSSWRMAGKKELLESRSKLEKYRRKKYYEKV